MKNTYRFIVILLFVLMQSNDVVGQTYARNGMITSSSKIASQVGVDILKKGGNAIDA